MKTDRDYIWAICFFVMVLAGCLTADEVEGSGGHVEGVTYHRQAVIGDEGCTLLLTPSEELREVTEDWAQKFRDVGFDVRLHSKGIPVQFGDLPIDEDVCERTGELCRRLADSEMSNLQDGTGLIPFRITIGHWLDDVGIGHAMGHEIAHLLRADHDAGLLMGRDLSIHYIDDATLLQMTSRVTCATQGTE